MVWFRRRVENPYGYEDRAALKGIGGYEPADPADATPAYLVADPSPASPPNPRRPESPEPEPTGASSTFLTSLPEAPSPRAIPARRRERTKAPSRLAVGLGAVGGVLALAGNFLATFSDDESAAPARPATTSVAPATAPDHPEPSVVVPAAVPGWQPVPGDDGAYAYDVPPSWVPRPDTVHGWEADENGPGITLATSAFTGEGYCAAEPDLQRGGSGATVIDQRDPGRAAIQAATALATQAYASEGGTPPRVDVGEPERTSLGGRDAAGSLVIVEVTPPSGEQCLPKAALVGAFAVNSSDGKSVVLVAYAAQEGPGATTREDLERILSSFRVVPEKDRRTVTAVPVIPAPTS